MASQTEIQVVQKERLYDLLLLEKKNSGKEVLGLNQLINRAKAGMSKEDIAYIEKLVNE